MKREFEKELEELSPFLADLKKQRKDEPFKTPRLYFDNLADSVIEKAKGETKTVTAPPQYNSRPSISNRISDWLLTAFQPKWALSALAFALVLVVGWYAVQQQKTTPIDVEQPVVVTHEAAQNYVKENIEDFNEEEIATAFEEPKMIEKVAKSLDTETTNVTPSVPKLEKVPTHPQSGLTEAEIEQYLLENLDERDIYALGNI